jgi:hypothetical protein
MSASSRQEVAFQEYVALGPSRNLRDLRAGLAGRHQRGRGRAPSLRTLEGWSSRYRWQERLADIERRAREEQEQQQVEWVKQYRERLRQEGYLLQQKGIEWLSGKLAAEVTAQAAIRAIDTGFKLEALALGEATERIAVEDEDERLKGLSDDELELFIREVRARLQQGEAAKGEAAP